MARTPGYSRDCCTDVRRLEWVTLEPSMEHTDVLRAAKPASRGWQFPLILSRIGQFRSILALLASGCMSSVLLASRRVQHNRFLNIYVEV